MFDSEILSLYTPWDLQDAIRDFLLERRKVLKKSRRSLAEQSGIPAPTIRRFEETGEISFRQFCVLWCTLMDFSHYFRWLFANFRECSLIS